MWVYAIQFHSLLTCNSSHLVLGSARTGLIFTRIQEGTRPGRLTQPGQTEQGIPYHVPSCWVLAGGAAGRLRSAWQQRSVRVVLCIKLFMLCFLLICIVVVTVPFVCCSVKLPLSRPTSFAFFFPFSSALQRGEGQPRGAFVAGRSQTITHLQHELSYTTPQILAFFISNSLIICLIDEYALSCLHVLF